MRNADFDLRGSDVPRALFPGGRIRFSLGAKGREAERRRTRMHDLRRWGAYDVLAAIQEGELDVAPVTALVTQAGEAALHPLRKQIRHRRAGSVPTFGDIAESYLTWYKANRRAGSYKGARSHLRRAVIALGALRIDSIMAADVEALLGAYTSGSTRLTLYAHIGGLYRWSVQREEERAKIEGGRPRWGANEDPLRHVERPEKSTRTLALSDDQVTALLDAALPYQEAYVRAFVELGFRLGELTHTRHTLDLDLAEWTWRIQARGPDPTCAASCPGCKAEGWRPKTRRSNRTIVVPNQLTELRRSIDVYLELYPCEPGERVFRNPRTGIRWCANRLSVDFASLCERAGVRYGATEQGSATIHTLRHTFATRMIRARCAETVLARIMGDRVETVSATYVHPTLEDLSNTLGRLPELAVLEGTGRKP